MKKLIPLLLILAVALSFVSCGLGQGGAEGGGDDALPENTIYDKSSELYLIVGGGVPSELASFLSGELESAREGVISYASADSAAHAHEIVIGKTDREISKSALTRLSRIETETDKDLSYLIYSDGSSVAIVFDEDEEGIVASLAIKYFAENLVKETLVCKSGVVYSETINILEDYYGAADEEYMNEKWELFESVAGADITAAMKRLYSIYSSDMLLWLANLYDPDICVCVDLYGESECKNTKYCGTAGFYFSNSARNTVGYLPDAESTNQTLNLLSSSGIGYLFDDRYSEFLPADMLDKIGDFITALQEPNGYFYHPQWGIEFTDTKLSRRGRDLNWAVSILNNLGRKPIYTTPTGVSGSGESTVSAPLSSSRGSAAVAVSAVVAANDAYASHLQDLSSFAAYLAAQDIYNLSYSVGNELTSQTSQIIARDKEIGTAEDPTPLMDYLIGWLNENQNPETGHWDWKKPGDSEYDAYYGVNGLLKISGIYTSAGVVIPNAMEGAVSAMNAITDETEIDAVVDLYNTWFAIRNILENLRKCGTAEDALEADEIVRVLRSGAAEAIDVSRVKISAFKKNDGSFSYTKNYSSSHSQGCPSAVPYSVEGDVNGNNIASTGLITYALSALDLLNYRVPLFGEKDRRVFVETIENLSPITKVEDVTVPEPITFDYDKTGESSEDLTVSLSNTGSSANVVKDPTSSGMGNVTAMISYSGGGDSVTVSNDTVSSLAKTAVFEGDICLVSSDTEYSVQFKMKDLYMLAFKVIDGKVHVREVSSGTSANGNEEELGIITDLGKWFSLRIEYYPGDHNSVRIKIYADTDLSDGKDLRLYAVSDNYFDDSGTKFLKPEGKPSASYNGAEFYVMNKPNLTMYLDNLNCYNTKTAYTAVIDPANQPVCFNVDAPDKDRAVYDFKDNEFPGDATAVIGGGAVAVNGEKLSVSYSGTGDAPSVSFPLTVRTAGSRMGLASFDLKVESALSGSRIILRGVDGGLNIYGVELLVSGEDISFISAGMSDSAAIGKATFKVGEDVNIGIEYYHAEDRVFVYLDGVFVGESRNLYSDGYKRTMDGFTLTVSGAVQISVDNLIAEKNNKSFADAMKPTVESKLWDFESADGAVLLEGSGTRYTGVSGNGAVEISSLREEGSVTIPVTHRATLYTVAILEAELSIKSASNNGCTHTVEINGEDGRVMFALALVKNGSKIELREVGKDGVMTTPLYTFSSLSGIKLSLKMFAENKTVYIYNNGSAVAKSGIFAGDDLSQPYASVTVRSGAVGSTAYLDNVRFETLYELYENVNVSKKANEETSTASPITFEYSSSGNIPAPVGQGISGVGSGLRVERTEKDGGYSNVLAFETVAGANDFINITSPENLGSYSAVAFEADILLDISTEQNTTCYQIYFSSKDSKNRVYLLQIAKDGNGFTLYDKSDMDNNSSTKSNVLKTGIKGGEWFRLKVEYYRGDRDGVRFVVSINGEVISVSDNFFGSASSTATPASAVECFYFYTLNKCEGTLLLDNVALYGFMGVCSEDVTTAN